MSPNTKKRAVRGQDSRTGRRLPTLGARTSGRVSRLLLALGLAASVAAGWAFLSSGSTGTTAAQPAAVVQSLSVRIHRELPHDTGAYTQGLLWWDGKLYESTGQYGRSDLRRLDPETGAVEQRVDISPAYFGEGLARVDDRSDHADVEGATGFRLRPRALRRAAHVPLRGRGMGAVQRRQPARHEQRLQPPDVP